MPHDFPSNQGGEVPQPQSFIFNGEWNLVSGGNEQNPAASTRIDHDKYRYEYLDDNNISNIADLKKGNWPNLAKISISKNMLIKALIK